MKNQFYETISVLGLRLLRSKNYGTLLSSSTKNEIKINYYQLQEPPTGYIPTTSDGMIGKLEYMIGWQLPPFFLSLVFVNTNHSVSHTRTAPHVFLYVVSPSYVPVLPTDEADHHGGLQWS